MIEFYLDLLPNFQEATQQILKLPTQPHRKLHAATKYEGKNSQPKINKYTRPKNRKK